MNLDANDLHFNNDDESKTLLVEDEGESKELMNCEKLPVDDTDNKRLRSRCSKINDETVAQGNAAEDLAQTRRGRKCEVPLSPTKY